MAKKLKIWNGASWEDVTFAITPPTTNVTNSFTTNQVIDTSTSVAALRVTQRGTGEALRVEDDTNPDSTPFVVTSSGNVGIGTATPDRPLKISGSSVSFGIIDTSTGGSELAFNPPQNSSGFAQIDVSGSNALRFNTNAAERVRIDSSGNVGIGTSNPLDRLHVEGEIRAYALHSTANNDSLELYVSNTFNSNGDGAISIRGTQSGYNNGGMEFYAGGIERIRLESNGRVILNSALSVTGANWTEAMLHLTGVNDANSHPGMTWHAPGASAVSLYHTRGWQGISVLGNSGTTDTASGRPVIRNISISTSNPSGGSDGDMWAVYV